MNLDELVREHLRGDAEEVRFDPRRWEEGVASRRPRPRMPDLRTLGTAVAALILLAGVAVPLALVSGLGGDRTVAPGGARQISGYGLRIDLPDGWDGRVRGPLGTSFGPHLHAANFELPEPDDDVASAARGGMNEGGVTIVVIDVTNALARDVRGPREPHPPATLPIRIRDEDFTDRVEAVYPDHAFARRLLSVGGRSLEIRVEFGTDPAPAELLDEANAVLATLSVEPAPVTAGYQRHVDLDDGLAITIPEAWTFREDPSEPIEPKNVFAVGSWAFARGGACAPTAAQDELPRDGVLFWLIEYVDDPLTTDDDPRTSEFPPRPERFELNRETLGVYECSTVPSYMVRFREENRYFQVHVAFGPEASDSLGTEVLRALDGLEVGGICDAADDAYVPAVAPSSGPVGSTATVTGEVPHGEGGPGGYAAPHTTMVEVWWNLDPRDPEGWPSALPGGEDPIPAEPGPVLRVGRQDVSTSCTYEVAFPVPQTPPGTYPIVILYGSEDGGSAFEPARFEVTS